MRFENLKFKEISINMTEDEKKAAIAERWDWLNNCEEKISPEKNVFLRACLEYAESRFHASRFNAATVDGYNDFNQVFKKIIKEKHQQETAEMFLIRIEPYIKAMRHRSMPANLLPDLLDAAKNKISSDIMIALLRDENSDLSQAVRGARNIWALGALSALAIEVYGILSRGDWASGIGLYVLNAYVTQMPIGPFSTESKIHAAKSLYDNFNFFGRVARHLDIGGIPQRVINNAKDKAEKLTGQSVRFSPAK